MIACFSRARAFVEQNKCILHQKIKASGSGGERSQDEVHTPVTKLTRYAKREQVTIAPVSQTASRFATQRILPNKEYYPTKTRAKNEIQFPAVKEEVGLRRARKNGATKSAAERKVTECT